MDLRRRRRQDAVGAADVPSTTGGAGRGRLTAPASRSGAAGGRRRGGGGLFGARGPGRPGPSPARARRAVDDNIGGPPRPGTGGSRRGVPGTPCSVMSPRANRSASSSSALGLPRRSGCRRPSARSPNHPYRCRTATSSEHLFRETERRQAGSAPIARTVSRRPVPTGRRSCSDGCLLDRDLAASATGPRSDVPAGTGPPAPSRADDPVGAAVCADVRADARAAVLCRLTFGSEVGGGWEAADPSGQQQPGAEPLGRRCRTRAHDRDVAAAAHGPRPGLARAMPSLHAGRYRHPDGAVAVRPAQDR
jgi:hypothetical protein